MTIGQLKETLLGKVLLDLGLYGDGTSFIDYPVKDICKLYQKADTNLMEMKFYKRHDW